MKLRKGLLSLTLLLALCWIGLVPQTAGAEEYTYTVRIYAGQQGVMVGGEGRIANGGEVLVREGLGYGQRIDFHNNMVSLKDGSKYYVKGIRQSGKGTEEISETGNSRRTASFEVTKDQDFVVAYGILTNPVQYTIYYRNAAGQDLAPSETYYGNVGDRPVIAYQYIEGYQPQAYNLTKTLTDDPAENVFTFIYSPLPDNTVYTNTTTTTVVSEGGGATAAPGATTAPETESSSQPEQDLPDNDVPNAQPDVTPQPEPTVRPPVNTWNLDDGDVPLADFDDMSLDEQVKLNSEGRMFWDHIPLAAKIAGGVVMLGGFAFALWLLLFRRRRKEDQ